MIKLNEWVEILPNEIKGFQTIKIIKGEFIDIEFVYGSVAFEESNTDEAHMKFEFDVLKGDPSNNMAGFEKLTGDILLSIIDDQLANNEVVYSGGVDGSKQ